MRTRTRIISLAAVAAAAALPAAASAAAGIDWDLRTSPAAAEWNSVAHGNGTFVAVARSGPARVMTSTDGVSWAVRTAPGVPWQAVAYGGGKFVAVRCELGGTQDRVMTSPDGVNWSTGRASSDKCWTSVAYGNGRFVAVGMGGAMASADGINWTDAGPLRATINSVVYAEGRFLAVSSGPEVLTSTDGVNWASQDSLPAREWTSVTHADGAYVAVAADRANDRQVATSLTGASWIQGFATQPTNSWLSVTHGAGMFVAVGSAQQGATGVMSSTNRIIWTKRTAPIPAGSEWRSITYANGMFVAVGPSAVMTSGTYTPSAGAATSPGGAAPATLGACGDTFYQQAGRTIRWNAARKAYRVVSRIRVFEDAPAACRTKLSVIYRSSVTKVSLAQKSGSTLGYRKLAGNFNAPVISWPTAREMRFTTGDTTGQNRRNARLVLVSYLKKARNMPRLNDIEMVIVRRIPRDPRAAQSSANPLYGQKNTFGRTRAWAGVS